MGCHRGCSVGCWDAMELLRRCYWIHWDRIGTNLWQPLPAVPSGRISKLPIVFVFAQQIVGKVASTWTGLRCFSLRFLASFLLKQVMASAFSLWTGSWKSGPPHCCLAFLSPRQVFSLFLVIKDDGFWRDSVFSCCVVLSFYGNSFKDGEFDFSS